MPRAADSHDALAGPSAIGGFGLPSVTNTESFVSYRLLLSLPLAKGKNSGFVSLKVLIIGILCFEFSACS